MFKGRNRRKHDAIRKLEFRHLSFHAMRSLIRAPTHICSETYLHCTDTSESNAWSTHKIAQVPGDEFLRSSRLFTVRTVEGSRERAGRGARVQRGFALLHMLMWCV